MHPVLMLGGSGYAGSSTAAMLRDWHPDLPLTIAGRDLGRAQQLADTLGTASAATVDLSRTDLGLPDHSSYSAVVATVWDQHLHGLRYAQDRAIPYLSISSGLTDIAPEIIAGGRRAPILLASHWAAGVITLATLQAVREFGPVETIEITAILDDQDVGGPAAAADTERIAKASPAAYVRQDSVFGWVTDTAVDIQSLDDELLPGQLVGILDVPSLALAAGAANVRFAFAMGESAGRRRGGSPSHDVRIRLAAGDRSSTSVLRHPGGQRPVTAVGIALGVERLLALRGDPVAPGIHSPEALIDPEYAVARLRAAGGVIETYQPIG
ncbi:saccharopine dehydrogenase [Kribbella sp. NPDC005582]|uniref:saccharopine dehydrogenase n=1 Tax=Kribbella sp. NPDC005582 TaxID=3156893 RepID=UPI0033B6234A